MIACQRLNLIQDINTEYYINTIDYGFKYNNDMGEIAEALDCTYMPPIIMIFPPEYPIEWAKEFIPLCIDRTYIIWCGDCKLIFEPKRKVNND